MIKRRVTLNEVLACLGGSTRTLGNARDYIETPSPIEEANAHSISYCADESDKAGGTIRRSRAGVIICSDKVHLDPQDYEGKTLILVSDPQVTMARVVSQFFEEKVGFCISPSAVIDKNAKIHPNVYVGPNCTIGRCEIGEGTIVYGNVFIFPDTRIGRNVVINPGAVIGAEGVLMTWRARLAHTGGVVIKDEAQIGSNVAIQRGMFSDTVIGESTVIGHGCTIGHQATIGKNCLIVTRSIIGGSCRIGDGAQVSLGACVRDKIRIGNNAIVGMGAVVTKDVDDKWVVVGNPAKKIREAD